MNQNLDKKQARFQNDDIPNRLGTAITIIFLQVNGTQTDRASKFMQHRESQFEQIYFPSSTAPNALRVAISASLKPLTPVIFMFS